MMSYTKYSFVKLVLNLAFFLTFSIPAAASDIDTEKTKNDWNTPAIKSSASGYYQVAVKSNTNPLPVNQFHSWVVHVESPEGIATENATILISGGMPEHKHGFPTEPRITRYMGNGDYLLEGMKFSMPGPWLLRLKIKAAGKTDKVEFNINL